MKRKQLTSATADWQLKPEMVSSFINAIGEAGHTRRSLTQAVWGNDYALRQRLKGTARFTDDEVQLFMLEIELEKKDVAKLFIPLTRAARLFVKGVEVEQKPVAPPPPPKNPNVTVTRIANGYQATFTGPDGKVHMAYGATEVDARVAMDKRTKDLKAKQEPPKEPPREESKGDRLSVTISGDEAMVLLNQLMIDFRNKAVNEKDKPVIQSIFLRLSTQII